MDIFIKIIVSFFSGMAASMGLGGGFVLLIYLTIFADTPQIEAQGINLIFFIPIAIISLFIHKKNNLIEKPALFPAILTGIAGCIIGVFTATMIPPEILNKIFGCMILLIGLKELFHKKKPS